MNTATEQTKKYKPYPKYKTSGVEWLGDVPEHWDVKRLRFLIELNKGKKPADNSESDEGLPYLTMNFLRGQEKPTNYIPSQESVIVKVGEILLLWDGANAGEFVKGCNGILSSTMTKISFDTQVCYPKYFFYFLKSFEVLLRGLTIGMGIPHVSGDIVKDCIAPVISLLEQRTIADFLDRRTGEIDDLIAKKELVIELLREKRTALISHAVTKGLNPDAKMKDSGVGWLGKVPKHWQVKRLRHIIEGTLVNGLFKKKEYFGSGVNLINVFDIYRDNFLVDTDSLERVEANKTEIEKYTVKSGDIFFVRSSLKLEGVGKSVCILDVAEPTVFECHVVRARPDTNQILPVFLINYLNSTITMNRLISLANMVTMTTLDQIKMKDIEVAVPPIVEQVAIAKYLKQEYLKTDALISKVIEAMEKLKEYRTALISVAVTGKINVEE